MSVSLFVGDMMGPFIDNLEGKIRMPYGCGEQNIQSLTPSMFVAKYLKAVDRYEPTVEAKVGKVCGFGRFAVLTCSVFLFFLSKKNK